MKSTEMRDAITEARKAANLVPFRAMSRALNLNLDVLEAIHTKLDPVLLALEGDELAAVSPDVQAQLPPAPPATVREAPRGDVSFSRPSLSSPIGEASYRSLAETAQSNQGGGVVETHAGQASQPDVAQSNQGGGVVELQPGQVSEADQQQTDDAEAGNLTDRADGA